MNATQRARKKQRALGFARDRERMGRVSHGDQKAIGNAHRDVNSKASAKRGKLALKATRETERYQPGYKGDGIATGKDSQGRFRLHDVAFRMSAKAWMRRGEG